MDGEKNSVVMEDRVTIDTSVPFRSVKEAVALFGERIMASQVTASRLSKMQAPTENKQSRRSSCLGSIAIQLEETRQEIKREHEKGVKMAKKILALEEELKSTKKKLKELKDRSYINVNPTMPKTRKGNSIDRKKKHVTFSDPLFAEILNIIVQDDLRDASRVEEKFAW